MPFIGNQPALSYTSFAVQHFTTSATTSYTLDHPVSNELDIRLVINNVVQQPGSSYAYTASGTTLTLSAATSATDTMYAVFLGKAVQTVTPASGSVTNAMLAGSIDLTSKVTGTLPVANGGTNLSSGFKNGIIEADAYRLSANVNTGTNAVISSNWERIDDASSFGNIGTGLTESSGIFSFPSTGLYYIYGNFGIIQDSSDAVCNIIAEVTTDNSSYDDVAMFRVQNAGNEEYGHALFFLVDVTDTSNVKFRFETTSFSNSSVVRGDTNITRSGFFCVRLGDT